MKSLFLLISIHRDLTWLVYFNSESILIPRSFTLSFGTKTRSSILIHILLFFGSPGNITGNLSGVATMRSNHFGTFSMSTSKHVTTSPMLSPEAYNVLSSAKLHVFDFSVQNIRSFRNILNSKVPRIEPCGTPNETQRQSLKVVPIFTRWFHSTGNYAINFSY